MVIFIEKKCALYKGKYGIHKFDNLPGWSNTYNSIRISSGYSWIFLRNMVSDPHTEEAPIISKCFTSPPHQNTPLPNYHSTSLLTIQQYPFILLDWKGWYRWPRCKPSPFKSVSNYLLGQHTINITTKWNAGWDICKKGVSF